MGGPREERGLTAASDWPRGIWAGEITPRTVAECFAVAFTATVDEVSGVHRNRLRGVSLPEGRTFREVYMDLGARIGVGRDSCADAYHGKRWLSLTEIERALTDPLLGPPMQRRLLFDGSCDVSRLLLGYASATRESGPPRSRLRQVGADPLESPAGDARSRKGGKVGKGTLRDAVRDIFRDGKPRRAAAVQAALRESFYGGPLSTSDESAVYSALSHLAFRGEIEKQADGRYRAKRLEASKEP